MFRRRLRSAERPIWCEARPADDTYGRVEAHTSLGSPSSNAAAYPAIRRALSTRYPPASGPREVHRRRRSDWGPELSHTSHLSYDRTLGARQLGPTSPVIQRVGVVFRASEVRSEVSSQRPVGCYGDPASSERTASFRVISTKPPGALRLGRDAQNGVSAYCRHP